MYPARLSLTLIAILTGTALWAEPADQPEAPVEGIVATALNGEAVVAPGDSLDRILGRAGIAPQVRAEAALALDGVYDLTNLRPGNILRWTARAGDPARLEHLSLLVAGGVEIELSFTDAVEALRNEPELTMLDRREILELNGSLYDALVAQNVPVRFTVELTALMAGKVDFRRDIRGGETLALIWQEERLPDGNLAGEPRLSYARLSVNGHDFELVSSDPGHVLLFKDGNLVQRSAPPVIGARISSVFGNRNHPILGQRRMHTGIDYAAATGTPVNATGAGRIIFTGTIRGYGLTIDIDHGAGVTTRYAHLSAITEGIAQGARVRVGDHIGAVGATGLVTGPNLHYEVLVDGHPVDPMEEDVLPVRETASVIDMDALRQGRLATGYSPQQDG